MDDLFTSQASTKLIVVAIISATSDELAMALVRELDEAFRQRPHQAVFVQQPCDNKEDWTYECLRQKVPVKITCTAIEDSVSFVHQTPRHEHI